MKDRLGTISRYVDDKKVGVTFDQIIDAIGTNETIVAEVYYITGSLVAQVNASGFSTTAGKKGEQKTVICNFSNIPVGTGYSIKFRTTNSGVLGKAALVIFAEDAFSTEPLTGEVAPGADPKDLYQPKDDTLSALADFSDIGIMVHAGSDNFLARSIVGTTNQIQVSNGNGVSGSPTIGLASNPVIPGTGSLTLPTGTTAQRGLDVSGKIRYNSENDKIEAYEAGSWKDVITATTGNSINNIKDSGNGMVNTATGTGALTWNGIQLAQNAVILSNTGGYSNLTRVYFGGSASGNPNIEGASSYLRMHQGDADGIRYIFPSGNNSTIIEAEGSRNLDIKSGGNLSLSPSGDLTLTDFGSGSNSGTATKYLAVTSAGKVIERDIPVDFPISGTPGNNKLITSDGSGGGVYEPKIYASNSGIGGYMLFGDSNDWGLGLFGYVSNYQFIGSSTTISNLIRFSNKTLSESGYIYSSILEANDVLNDDALIQFVTSTTGGTSVVQNRPHSAGWSGAVGGVTNVKLWQVSAGGDWDYQGNNLNNIGDITISNIAAASSDEIVTVDNTGKLKKGGTAPTGSIYVPTTTGLTNISLVSASASMYSRVANIITVSSTIQVLPTAGSTLTTFGISFPVPSSITNSIDVVGVATDLDSNTIVGSITADVANNRAKFTFMSQGTSSLTFTCIFQYQVK